MALPRAARIGLAILVVTAGLAGCLDPEPNPGTNSSDPDANDSPAEPNDSQPRETIAWNRVPSDDAIPRADNDRLMDLVERQVSKNGTGEEPRYRTPGTPGHESTIPDLEAMLNATGAEVSTERFPVELPLGIGEVNATNVYGVREGGGDEEIWIAAHWDSRAEATEAMNPDNRDKPVLGANDGAAGVAVAVHALELMPETDLTVRVALFDAEDQGESGSDLPRGGWIQGSSHAAERLEQTGRLEDVRALVLVDMPGHEEPMFQREGQSDRHAPDLTDLVFGVAERTEADAFVNRTGSPVLDDHIPFLEREVRATDVIHLDDNGTSAFPWTWHTRHDTMEHVSGDAMAEVTRVVVGTAMAVDRGALPPDGS